MNVAPEGETQVFDRLGIERIDECDLDRVILVSDRQGAMEPGEAGRDETQNLRRELDRFEVDHLRPEGVGDGEIELVLVDDAVIDHRLFDRLAVLRRREQNVVGLGPIHQALVDEEVGDAFVIHVGNDE